MKFSIPNLFQKKRSSHQTLFHVTHAKAGSSWLYGIFKNTYGDLVPDRVGSKLDELHIEEGKIYSALFCKHEDYLKLPLADSSPHFFVIRDIRDTLVSLYFSQKYSHIPNQKVAKAREIWENMTDEEGILYCFKRRTKQLRAIQKSWIDSGAPVYKYEDLFESDGLMLLDVLKEIGFETDFDRLESVIRNSTFEKSFGRKPGDVDVTSHGRSGVAGSWKKYRTDELDEIIERDLSEHLKLTGYHLDL